MTLDLVPLVVPDYTPDLTIQQRFDAWIEVNAWIIPTVERLITEWLAAGHSKVGIKSLWETIRWQYGVTTGDKFRANNDFTSRVARLVIERNPLLADAIETRTLRAA